MAQGGLGYLQEGWRLMLTVYLGSEAPIQVAFNQFPPIMTGPATC